MKQKLIFLIIILLILLGGFRLWITQAFKPPNRLNNNYISFTIKRGESIKDIAERLQKQGLIRSSVAFFIRIRFGGMAKDIQSGDFRLSPSMNLADLVNSLMHGTSDVQITFPEGWRNEEISLTLAKYLNIPENEFLKIAKIGYMFPDTYFIPKDASAEGVVKILYDNFKNKVPLSILNKSTGKNLTFEDIIKIASLVEREAKFEKDRPYVASVVINRLNLGMKLDIDATIQYALGYQPHEKSWWKKELTTDDLALDNPYNTYKKPGLPPTPISNPGYSSIIAVVEAPKTDYLYYVSDKSGHLHFAKTIEEHNGNIEKYLNK